MSQIKLTVDVPNYALPMLWLAAPDRSPQQLTTNETMIEGGDDLALRWGTPDGAVLFHWEGQSIRWLGAVAIEGHIDRLHIIDDLIVIEVIGYPIEIRQRRLPTLAMLKEEPFDRDSFASYPDDEYWYAFVMDIDSDFVDFANHALVNGGLVQLFGGLATDDNDLQRVVGLPLVLDSMTLLGS